MSGRGSYSQKKKREAVRRLSQQHSRQGARGRPSSGPIEPGRRRRSVEKRRRPDDEAGTGVTRSLKRDDGKRFISPLNNPVLAPAAASASAPGSSSGGLFGKASAPASSQSASNLFSQSASSSSSSSIFPSASSSSAGLFGKPVESSANPFQSSSFGAFGPGTEAKTSVFGKPQETPSTGFKVTFGAAGSDDAGTGGTNESLDSLQQTRQVVSREPSTGEPRQHGSGLFRKGSPRKDDPKGQTSGGLFGKQPQSKKDVSKLFQQPRDSSTVSPMLRDTSPSRRSVESFDDPFGSDISDLETFGQGPAVKDEPKIERESLQGRSPVKRTGLFGKALGEVGGRERDRDTKRRRDEDAHSKGLSTRSQKTHSTFASKSDIKTLSTIICKEVPDALNNRNFLGDFFSRFGQVNKVSVNPRKTMATVYFNDHDSAAKAKKMVKSLKSGTRPIAIFWGQRDKGKETTVTRKIVSDENIPPPFQQKVEPVLQQKREPSPAASIIGRSSKCYITANERYEELEERDKKIRKGKAKQLDLASAKKMVGTCLDMCPEKERYMREVQRRLSPYEMVSGTEKVEKGENPQVDHRKAVKEYSRSSADQEEPLPSELRKPRVLEMTMDYLMRVIMNREPSGPGGDGRSWGDWFDFLWNRTRSIRKEITQQQMGGTIAVGLMEQCARRINRGVTSSGTAPGASGRRSRSNRWVGLLLWASWSSVPGMCLFSVDPFPEVLYQQGCDFLSNRTRSIRKEITQQQMGGTIAVGLMEQCARFHIYCSYRLCEEDRMTFDPKINNENLTKCLQSLKHIYHDLADEGVFCPNEAEFRGYEVLLNLTGGDILREVQQYRPSVRSSEAVMYALKVSTAFSSNNYCRFFKLIRSGSFLNVCIMHRYFVQVRSVALETMNKAFTTPKGVASFPTSELVQLLAFEDEEQASVCCECHGLTSTDTSIQFNRTAFFYPEEALLPQRAPSVIEAKNNRSVAEVVNGAPLPVRDPHIPVSSFDEQGRFVERSAEVKPSQVTPIPRVTEVHGIAEIKPQIKMEKPVLQKPVQVQEPFQQPLQEVMLTPQPAAAQVPGQDPGKAPGSAPGQILGQAPGLAPGSAFGQVPGSTPAQAPGLAPGQAPGSALGAAPAQVPGSAFGQPPGSVPGSASGLAPGPAPIPTTTQQVQVEEKPKISNELVKDLAKDLFLEVIDDMVRHLSFKFVEALLIIQNAPVVIDHLVTEEVGKLSHVVATETVKEERYRESRRKEEERQAAEAARRERERREKEKSALMESATMQLSQEMVDEVVVDDVRNITLTEVRLYQAELRQETIQRSTAAISQDLLQEVVTSEVAHISSEVIDMATAERDRRLAEIAAAIQLRQLHGFFQNWRRVHSKRVKIRRALETFPAGPPNQNAAEQLRVLWPWKREPGGEEPGLAEGRPRAALPLSLHTPYVVVSERETLAKHILHHHYLARIRQERAWAPLDLPTIHRDNFHPSHHASSQGPPSERPRDVCQYWKLVASLPAGSHDGVFSDWLKAKLRRGKMPEELRRRRLRDSDEVETLSLYTQRVGSRPVGVCTKALTGQRMGRDGHYQMLGSSGLLLAVHVPSRGQVEACCHEARQRVDAILSHTPSDPPLPVLMCVTGDGDLVTTQARVQERLGLDHLKGEGSIASWKVVTIPQDVLDENASQQLGEGMAWLASHHPRPTTVSCESVKEYLDNGLARFFSTGVQQQAKIRKESGQLPLLPEAIVDLYNSVVVHLASVASSRNLTEVSWPPSEFTSNQHPDLPSGEWNATHTLDWMYSSIQHLQLPQLQVQENTDWSSVHEACISYIRLLPGSDSDKAPLLSRVRWLLDKSRRSFEALCFMTFDTEGCEPTSQHAPWADILEECVSYNMTFLSQAGEGDSPFSEQLVYFYPSELSSFELPPSWLQEMNQTLDETVVEQESLQQSFVDIATRRRSALDEEEEREKEERRRRRTEEAHCHDNSSFLLPEDSAAVTMTRTKAKTSRLRKMMDREKEESNRFESLLSSLLADPLEGLQPAIQMESLGSEFRLQLPALPKASPQSEPNIDPKLDAPSIHVQDADVEDDSLSGQIRSLKQRLAVEKEEALRAEMRLNALLGL